MSEVKTSVPIESLIQSPESYGANLITNSIMEKLVENTDHKISHFLKRGIFNGEIGFLDAINHAKSNKPLYIYLSITPTNRLTHLRHLIFFEMAKYLQNVLNCYVFIHVLDFKAHCKYQANNINTWVNETLTDVLAFDFNNDKTIVLLNEEAIKLDYILLCDLQRRFKLGSFVGRFFNDDQVNTGHMDVVFQNCACGCSQYVKKIFSDPETRCLMLLRPSQKNVYDFSCELAATSKSNVPCALFGGFVSSLHGGAKMPKVAHNVDMVKSQAKNIQADFMTIYLKDDEKTIQRKLNKYAFSGGRDPFEEQEKHGADLSVDVAYHLFRLFSKDDKRLDEISHLYGPGTLADGEKRMGSGHVKKEAASAIYEYIKEFQARRSNVTKEMLQKAKVIRSLC